ncbi:hypothetical protein L6164_018271 [Bauhinia variegata]|uniref:Uncharacterized protein n=1 Tax=Bauhinia variegata TaxID=167791 RepID=A0ACB9NBW4_BAUVA|nr:hypothetical protein L6164_018271 [Bauhinia variegata]
MDALWDLEDKLKLTTAKALVLLGGATIAIVGLCVLTMLKRKATKNKVVHQEEEEEEAATDETESVPKEWSEPSCGWMSVKKAVLMGSMRWCRAGKWEEKNAAWQRQRGSTMASLDKHGHEIGWQSHNSTSAVWQRPILRGEKCELPRFSGLILYDEKGRLLPDFEKETSNQEKTAVTVRTTLRDLL